MITVARADSDAAGPVGRHWHRAWRPLTMTRMNLLPWQVKFQSSPWPGRPAAARAPRRGRGLLNLNRPPTPRGPGAQISAVGAFFGSMASVFLPQMPQCHSGPAGGGGRD